jgi:hypothetical protein
MSEFNPSGMTTKDLLALYNDCAAELGERPVARFADRESAERRTVAMHERVLAARVATPPSEPLKYDKAGKDRVQIAAGSALDAIREAEPELVAQAEKDHGKRAQKAPAAAIPADQLKAPTPPLTTKRPRWAAPKEEKPCKRAIRPKPGTVQDKMYALLTAPGGIAVEAFCEEMQRLGNKNKSWKEPAGVWSGLRYLFCALRGYGLRFDGARLYLLVPPVEQDAVRKEAKGGA